LGVFSDSNNSYEDDPMVSLLIRIVIPVIIIVSVSELSRRLPRVGALLLSLPLTSLLAFGVSWYRDSDIKSLSSMARETLILVPLGLPFFLPLAFAERLGIGFWAAVGAGIILAGTTIGLWLALASVE
jgi:hypothetical protein